ncbi:MAG: L-threonylcarbamoyladenylate synthase [Rhodothermales bacterium]
MNVTVPIATVLTDSPEEAAAYIRRGALAAFPTETVYGLGADVFQPAAIASIYAAKSRPADNPLIIHVADAADIDRVAASVPPVARALVEAFFPGPITLVLPRHPDVPDIVSAGLATVAVRMPSHPIARAFLEACGTPVAAPSANRSGRPSPTTWEDVYADLKGRIGCILQGDPSAVGLESTVVDCTTSDPLILRPGAVSLEEIRTIAPAARYADLSRLEEVRSPGLKHRHYAPQARVVLVDGPSEVPAEEENAYIGLTPHPRMEALGLHEAPEHVPAYAQQLFQFFRRADRLDLETIFCQRVDQDGIGRALMDRLTRAAAG